MSTTAARSRERATLLMSVGTLLSRLTGLGRLVALAYALGLTHRLTDAYNLANTTPNIVFDFVLGGVLSATLIPIFVDRLATRSPTAAWEAISAVVSLVAVLLAAMTLLFELAAPLLIRIYTFSTPHSGQEVHAATVFLRMFAPQLAFYGLIVLSTALLNTRRRFGAPMFAPIANNIVVILVLVAVRHLAEGLSVSDAGAHGAAFWLLGVGTTAGVAVQLVAQLPSMAGTGIHLRWVWAPRHEAIRRMVRLSGWTFGFVAANQVALWVVLLLANRRVGDVSVWLTSYTFFQLPFGVVAVSIMSAIQPELAESWSRRDVAAFRTRMAAGLRGLMGVIVPATVAYLLLARPALELFLRHGATGTAGAERAAVTTAVLALGLPGFCAFQLFVRSFQSMQNTRTPFFLYLLENGLNIVLAFALWAPLGVRGLAASVSAAYTIAALVGAWQLRGRLGGIEGTRLVRHLGRLALPTVSMAVAIAFVGVALAGESSLVLLARVFLAVVAGALVYIASATVLARRQPPPARGRPGRPLSRAGRGRTLDR